MFEVLVSEKAPDNVTSEGEAKNELSADTTLRQTAEILKDLKRRIPSLE